MNQFHSQEKKPRAWLLMTFGQEQTYGGHLGYTDELSKVYQYDSFVSNYRQITEGDFALLRDKQKLLGIARIERIDTRQGNKERFIRPECGTPRIYLRKTKNPKFRCQNAGGHIFDPPVRQVVSCNLYTAYFGNSFISAEAAVSLATLRKACPRYNEQLAMQLLDFKLVETALLEKVPAVEQLLAVQNNLDYIEADDAEPPVNTTENQSLTPYFPILSDSRQAVMRQIRVRRGQRTFRQALRARYGNQCMITGCQLLDIIEAAHILPYRGDADNHPENGLLLRADLHTLFDLDLVGIEPESLKVQFHPATLTAGYGVWNGKTLLWSNARPSQAALEFRWRLFLIRLQKDN